VKKCYAAARTRYWLVARRWIDERPGGVTLRVVESGLAGLGKDSDALRKHYEGNSEGWEAQLQAAKRFVLGDAGSAA